ncbi:MAG: HU family DNA-binding protein [Bacteroidia bacterium]
MTLKTLLRVPLEVVGTFNLCHRAPRIARNPRTGESINLPAKVTVHFKPDMEMKDQVNAARNQSSIKD